MSAIPDFIDKYHLPPGVHECSVQEIEERFLWSERRKDVWRLFKIFLERLEILGIIPDSILIDGSFVTGREEPGDVDVCLLIPPKKLSNAYRALNNEEDRICLEFICNPRNQRTLRLSFGTHPIIVPDEVRLEKISEIFRTGGTQFHHLRPPDSERDPKWVETPAEKGILRVNL